MKKTVSNNRSFRENEYIHGVIIVVFILLFLAINHFIGFAAQKLHKPAIKITGLDPKNISPELLLIGGSYGRQGLHVDIFNKSFFGNKKKTARWFCDGTDPISWYFVLQRKNIHKDLFGKDEKKTGKTRVIVLLLPPPLIYNPSPFKDFALRRLYSVADIPKICRLGTIGDAAQVLTVKTFPAYRSRRGIRQQIMGRALNFLCKNNPEKLKHVPAAWSKWEIDTLQVDALIRTAVWTKKAGVILVVAEWPVSTHVKIEEIIQSGFRPEIKALSEKYDFIFIPLPESEKYTFSDWLHPQEKQGRRCCRWLVSELQKGNILKTNTTKYNIKE